MLIWKRFGTQGSKKYMKFGFDNIWSINHIEQCFTSDADLHFILDASFIISALQQVNPGCGLLRCALRGTGILWTEDFVCCLVYICNVLTGRANWPLSAGSHDSYCLSSSAGKTLTSEPTQAPTHWSTSYTHAHKNLHTNAHLTHKHTR